MQPSESAPSSPQGALVPLLPHPSIDADDNWQPILHASNQVVLYNPTSHALSIRHRSTHSPTASKCPYCHRPLPHEYPSQPPTSYDLVDAQESGDLRNRVANYFQLLAVANETSSRPITPVAIADEVDAINGASNMARSSPRALSADAMADGYFKAFFKEECKLGMGANGSVFLCQHVLHGTSLGHFAVKKIAVGESQEYLLRILREVRLLERLQHPNIITYHHAWLESCQFSAFGPNVPTLHVLMQWAEGGSLDDFIEHRLGRPTRLPHLYHHHRSPSSYVDPSSSSSSSLHNAPAGATNPNSRTARIRAFREYQHASPAERERMRRAVASGGSWKAVHLLSAKEVKGLFGDVVEGLSFLHDRSILHLDLKPGNVLLTWEEGELIPRAMLSDFGTSRDMMRSNRVRSGNTGTLEYTSPESLPCPDTGILANIDSKADMWSLGMILHKLLFFHLPYRYARDGGGTGAEEEDGEGARMDKLQGEVLSYPGFRATPGLKTAFEARRLPHAFLFLLERLLNVRLDRRPSCEIVARALREGEFDPVIPASVLGADKTSLVPLTRRPNGTPPAMDERQDGDMPSLVDKEENMGAPPTPLLLGLPPPPGWERTEKLGRRTVKSVLLIVKVSSISDLWERSRALVLVLLAVAVVDMWFDELWVTLALGGVHFGVVWLVRGVI